jgi:predicted RNase H-like nuclease
MARLGTDTVVAVDMPVGLTAAGPRTCDIEARRYLGFPRSASVFSAPIRPALRARTWEQACAIRERVDRKRYQIQAFGLFPKVREVDILLRAEPRYQGQVYEAHPEVTFAAMNDGLGMAHSKKRSAGRKERLAVIERCLGPKAVALYEDVCGNRRSAGDSGNQQGSRFTSQEVGRDDLIDALALVWAARRIAMGQHRMLPESEERDPMGLRMNIHY